MKLFKILKHKHIHFYIHTGMFMCLIHILQHNSIIDSMDCEHKEENQPTIIPVLLD